MVWHGFFALHLSSIVKCINQVVWAMMTPRFTITHLSVTLMESLLDQMHWNSNYDSLLFSVSLQPSISCKQSYFTGWAAQNWYKTWDMIPDWASTFPILPLIPWPLISLLWVALPCFFCSAFFFPSALRQLLFLSLSHYYVMMWFITRLCDEIKPRWNNLVWPF